MSFPLNVCVRANEVKTTDNKQSAWYTIRCSLKSDEKTYWEVAHRYSQFKSLHQSLAKISLPRSLTFPSLPSSKAFRNLEPVYLATKQQELNDYIVALSRLTPITVNQEFIQFLVNDRMLEVFHHVSTKSANDIEDLRAQSSSLKKTVNELTSKREKDYRRVSELTLANQDLKSRLVQSTGEFEAQSQLLRIREDTISEVDAKVRELTAALEAKDAAHQEALRKAAELTEAQVNAVKAQMLAEIDTANKEMKKLKRANKILIKSIKMYRKMEADMNKQSEVSSPPSTPSTGPVPDSPASVSSVVELPT